MSVQNEKLIEEAAKAIEGVMWPIRDIMSVASGGNKFGADTAFNEAVQSAARAALAVFEKAHTPTEPPTSENAYTGIPLSEVIRSEQGEPSDAQVRAACQAFSATEWDVGTVGAMRAALRAAGGVR